MPRKPTLAAQVKAAEMTLRLNRLNALNAKYDATQNGGTKRRAVQKELQAGGEAAILPMSERTTGIALNRDLERNYSNLRGIQNQFKVNVVGTKGQCRVNAGEAGKAAAVWFNSVWSKNCDARGDDHWREILGNVLTSVLRDGDCLIAIDDGWMSEDEGTGQLWAWEGDQICPMEDGDFVVWQTGQRVAGLVQDQGIVRDKLGKTIGYFVTGKRGKSSGTKDELVFIPGSKVKLVKIPWRLNQGRGVASMLTAANDLFDLYDFRSRELQTAKVAASLAGKVKRTDAITNWDAPTGSLGLLPENIGQSATEIANQTANGGTDDNYERFESLTGGYLEYMGSGDDFEMLNIDRPNVNAEEFHDFVLTSAGASMGLARAYSKLRADSSYTAFRGDMIMSWQMFYSLQKWLENKVCDWVAIRVLTWAQRTGAIQVMEAGWESKISWSWPTMPEVDPKASEDAIKLALKNGTKSYADLLGPEWRERLEAIGEEIKMIKELGLPLSITETIGGTSAASNNKTQESSNGMRPNEETQAR